MAPPASNLPPNGHVGSLIARLFRQQYNQTSGSIMPRSACTIEPKALNLRIPNQTFTKNYRCMVKAT
jgi:hypothetical protein